MESNGTPSTGYGASYTRSADMTVDNWARRASGLWCRTATKWRWDPCQECCSSSGESSSSSSGEEVSSSSGETCNEQCRGCHGYPATYAAPLQFRVVISGITNGTCSECTSLNGTFVLTYLQDLPCTYRYTFPSRLCNKYDYVDLWFDTSVPGAPKMWVSFGSVGTYWESPFRKDWASRPECCQISNTNVPYIQTLFADCVFANATCTATALP